MVGWFIDPSKGVQTEDQDQDHEQLELTIEDHCIKKKTTAKQSSWKKIWPQLTESVRQEKESSLAPANKKGKRLTQLYFNR